ARGSGATAACCRIPRRARRRPAVAPPGAVQGCDAPADTANETLELPHHPHLPGPCAMTHGDSKADDPTAGAWLRPALKLAVQLAIVTVVVLWLRPLDPEKVASLQPADRDDDLAQVLGELRATSDPDQRARLAARACTGAEQLTPSLQALLEE